MNFDGRTYTLVGLIKRIAKIAGENNKRYYVGSGFSVDLSLGRLTRNHEDIDLVVEVVNTKWWKEVFRKWGYEIGQDEYMGYFPNSFSVRKNLKHNEDYLIEVWPMEFRDDETLYPPHTANHPGREWWKGKKHTTLKQVRYEGENIRVEDPNVAIDQKLDHVRYHKELLSEKHINNLKLMNRLEEYEELTQKLELQK